MNVMALLDTLESILEDASKVPFSGKVSVDREDLLEITRNIRIQLPDEVKQAQWINDERQSIIEQAKSEAAGIIKEYETKTADIQSEREKIIGNADKLADAMKRDAQDIMENAEKIKDKTLSEASKQAEARVNEATRIAENMIQDADKKAKMLVDQSELVRRSTEKAGEIIKAAQMDARKIRLGSMRYADDVLSELEKHTKKIMEAIQKNKDEMRNYRS